MSYTDEFYKREGYSRACLGDLFELTVDEAAQKIYKGLRDPKQATVNNIKDAIIADIQNGNLKVIRGSANVIGKYSNNPAIIDAYVIDLWAEKNGLDLENDGSWSSYINDELELALILEDKLEALRSLQKTGLDVSEIIKSSGLTSENQRDKFIKYFTENMKLTAQIASEDLNENTRMMAAAFKLISTMAKDAYGYDYTDKKSPVPAKLVKIVSDTLDVKIDEDTVRKWLKMSASEYPPAND